MPCLPVQPLTAPAPSRVLSFRIRPVRSTSLVLDSLAPESGLLTTVPYPQFQVGAIAIHSNDNNHASAPLALSRLLVILAWVSPKGRHLLHELTSQVRANPELPRLLRILFASVEFGSPFVMYVPLTGGSA